MFEENVCDLFDELKFYRAKQAVLRAALNEIVRLTEEFNDDGISHSREIDRMVSDTIQSLEYCCADIESELLQRTKKN
jgi:hypothetical protein